MDSHLYTKWENELKIRSVGHTPCAGGVSARIHELQSALITIAERLKKAEERIRELERQNTRLK